MNRMTRVFAVAALSATFLGTITSAQAQSHGEMIGPWWNHFEPITVQKSAQVAMMPPEERSKVMAMEDKIAQAEMDFQVQMSKAMAQHEMEMTKMRRDLVMYINSVYPPLGTAPGTGR